MELAQCRIVTNDVEALARFYAGLVNVDVTLNEYYVEVPAGSASIGFSRCHFAGFPAGEAHPACASPASSSSTS